MEDMWEVVDVAVAPCTAATLRVCGQSEPNTLLEVCTSTLGQAASHPDRASAQVAAASYERTNLMGPHEDILRRNEIISNSAR